MNKKAQIKRELYAKYRIKVKKIRIHHTIEYFGETFYLPYRIEPWTEGCVVRAVPTRQYYLSLDQILEDAQSGVFGKVSNEKR